MSRLAKIVRLLGLPLVVTLTVGCAPSYWDTIEALQEAPLCCQSPKDFVYHQLQAGETKHFPINDESPAYLFRTGKSYFLSFKLPEAENPYQVVVSSFALDDASGLHNQYIFSPSLVTYDADFKQIRQISPSKRLLRASMMETGKASMSAVQIKTVTPLSLSDINNDEKYLVIMTTDDLLAEKTGSRRNSATGILRIDLIPENPSQ